MGCRKYRLRSSSAGPRAASDNNHFRCWLHANHRRHRTGSILRVLSCEHRFRSVCRHLCVSLSQAARRYASKRSVHTRPAAPSSTGRSPRHAHITYPPASANCSTLTRWCCYRQCRTTHSNTRAARFHRSGLSRADTWLQNVCVKIDDEVLDVAVSFTTQQLVEVVVNCSITSCVDCHDRLVWNREMRRHASQH